MIGLLAVYLTFDNSSDSLIGIISWGMANRVADEEMGGTYLTAF